MRHRSAIVVKRAAWAWLIIVLGVVMAGCPSARLAQFDRFATAGTAYTRSIHTLLDASVRTSVEADNRVLLMSRELVSDPDFRREALNDHDDVTKARMRVMADVGRHTRLLENYFLAIAALATRDQATSLGESATGFANALGALNKDLATEKIGDQSVADFLGQAVAIVVASRQRAFLDEVLEDTADTVGRSIDVHGAVLEAVRAQLLADLELIADDYRERLIAAPFVGADALPEDWGQRRADWLDRNVTIAELDQAISASHKLKLAFVALVENKLDSDALALMIQDIQRLAGLAAGL